VRVTDARLASPSFNNDMNEQRPASLRVAVPAIARCIASTVAMLVTGRFHVIGERRGVWLRFADGTSSEVFRETISDHVASDPCLLVVGFRLRFVRGFGHALFRVESILNTILFAGFGGYVSKLWMDHDSRGVYRGVYEWDGADRAERYARSLWRILALVSVRGSIRYWVVPGIGRDEALADPGTITDRGMPEWARIVRAEPRATARRPGAERSRPR